MEYKSTKAKDWAKGFYKGLETSILLPLWFYSTVLIAEAGTNKDEDKFIIPWRPISR